MEYLTFLLRPDYYEKMKESEPEFINKDMATEDVEIRHIVPKTKEDFVKQVEQLEKIKKESNAKM